MLVTQLIIRWKRTYVSHLYNPSRYDNVVEHFLLEFFALCISKARTPCFLHTHIFQRHFDNFERGIGIQW